MQSPPQLGRLHALGGEHASVGDWPCRGFRAASAPRLTVATLVRYCCNCPLTTTTEGRCRTSSAGVATSVQGRGYFIDAATYGHPGSAYGQHADATLTLLLLGPQKDYCCCSLHSKRNAVHLHYDEVNWLGCQMKTRNTVTQPRMDWTHTTETATPPRTPTHPP